MPPPSSVRINFLDHGDDLTNSAVDANDDEAAADPPAAVADDDLATAAGALDGSAEAAYETRLAGLRIELFLRADGALAC